MAEGKKTAATQSATNQTSTRSLSAREQAIHERKKVISGTASDRVVRMFEGIRAYGPPRVALERSVLFTEGMKENENDPLVLKWAKGLKNYAEKSTVAILDDELIVGRPNTWLGRWAIVYGELDATKGAVVAFTKSVGMEVAGANIYVNCIAAGGIMPPAFESYLARATEEEKNRFYQLVPAGRLGRMEEYASLVVYLTIRTTAHWKRSISRSIFA